MNTLWYCFFFYDHGWSRTVPFSHTKMAKMFGVWANKCNYVSMTFPEHDSELQPSYPIFALTGGDTVLETTLLICIVHLPWSHSGVQEVSFQRLIVQTCSPTWAVKKTNLQWDWLLYRGFICVQQEKKVLWQNLTWKGKERHIINGN